MNAAFDFSEHRKRQITLSAALHFAPHFLYGFDALAVRKSSSFHPEIVPHALRLGYHSPMPDRVHHFRPFSRILTMSSAVQVVTLGTV